MHAYEICLKNVSYDIRKIGEIRAPPPDPRRYLDNEMSLHTHTAYVKGILGIGGGALRTCLYKPKILQSSDKRRPFSK